MHISDDIHTTEDLKRKTSELLKQVRQTRRPILITDRGKPQVVIQDAAAYEKMRNATTLLKLIAHSEDQISSGNTLPQREVFRRLKRQLRG